MNPPLTLRPIEDDDQPFLLRVYGSTRAGHERRYDRPTAEPNGQGRRASAG